MVILNDFNTSVERALSEIDPKWRDYPGLIVCGTHTPVNVEQTIARIGEARRNKEPFLGICFGHQLAWIEYCRNVWEIADATSEEFSDHGTFVVKRRPQMKVGLHEGETYWSNYDICITNVVPWYKNDNFITVPYHPEYGSTKEKPHPVLIAFLEYAKLAV